MSVPGNVYRTKPGNEERYCQAESLVFWGGITPPEVKRRGEASYEVTTAATSTAGGPAIRSFVVRFRGNEELIAELVRKADWPRVRSLLEQ